MLVCAEVPIFWGCCAAHYEWRQGIHSITAQGHHVIELVPPFIASFVGPRQVQLQHQGNDRTHRQPGALLVPDEMALLIPLFLGIIASALAETDDGWQGRLSALAVTLVCFAIAALSVELLFPYPGSSLAHWPWQPSP